VSEPRQDPWGDMPRWSDGEEAAGAAAAGDAPSVDGVSPAPVAVPTSDPWFARAGGALAADIAPDAPAGAADPAAGPAEAPAAHAADACAWCATPAAPGATRCTTCGAALAQRESIGDLVIPGLTAVDPALKDLDGRPIHLRGPSPTQGAASGIIVAAAAGGPIGLAILGGVGAIAATEFLTAGGEKGKGHEHVGEMSEAVLQAVERLDRGETLPTAKDSTPMPELGATSDGAQGVANRNEEGRIDGHG
jgi:hypothetical protein